MQCILPQGALLAPQCTVIAP